MGMKLQILKSDNFGQRKYNVALCAMAFVNVQCFGGFIGEKVYLSSMLAIIGLYQASNLVNRRKPKGVTEDDIGKN